MRPTVVAGAIGGVFAAGASLVAVLDYLGVRPPVFGDEKTAEQPKAPTERAAVDAAATAPSDAAPGPAPGPEPSTAASAVAPRVQISLKDADLAEYSHNYYRAVLRFEVANPTDHMLKLAWLKPDDLQSFSSDAGATFAGPNASLRKLAPSGVTACWHMDGETCWNRRPESFVALPPGEKLTAVINLRRYVALRERTPFPTTVEGTFSGQVFVVDDMTKLRGVQPVSMDLALQNPSGH